MKNAELIARLKEQCDRDAAEHCPAEIIALQAECIAAIEALEAEVERLTTLAHGQHIELYNARLQLAAAQGQEPVNAMLVEDVNSEIVKRYKVEKTKGGFWPYCVKAGDGTMGLFIGSKKQADHVQQALQSACLDGAFMAFAAAKKAQPVRPINCGTGHCSCIECPYEQAQPEPVWSDGTTPLVEGGLISAGKVDHQIRAFMQAQPERAPLSCTWTQEDDFDTPGVYHTSCGEMWSFTEGGIKENNTKFCPHCGGGIKQGGQHD